MQNSQVNSGCTTATPYQHKPSEGLSWSEFGYFRQPLNAASCVQLNCWRKWGNRLTSVPLDQSTEAVIIQQETSAGEFTRPPDFQKPRKEELYRANFQCRPQKSTNESNIKLNCLGVNPIWDVFSTFCSNCPLTHNVNLGCSCTFMCPGRLWM